MRISRNWLQSCFVNPLPSNDSLEKAFTFHVFEIDGIEEQGGDSILDVKVTPNRGHDCLCHLGIAKELSAILNLPLTSIELEQSLVAWPSTTEDFVQATRKNQSVSVTIQTDLCSRYISAHVAGVTVGPSPEWLRKRLESIGQGPINNVVDATNYVMFHIGQPLHAFDASKLEQKDRSYSISVRTARSGEKLLALDDKEYALEESTMVIADANKDAAIGIAGIKGGKPAGITETTTDIIIESANFNGASVRKTAQALKLRTDASQRFEQVISPELAKAGMDMVIKLIQELAGGEVRSFVDEYPHKQIQSKVLVTLKQVQQLLGNTFTDADIIDSFDRLRFEYEKRTIDSESYVVTVPFERLDLTIPEDLVEEIGRIGGYDRVPAIELPLLNKTATVNKNLFWAEAIREHLLKNGFSEVFTSVFRDAGERVVLNKVDGQRPYLRTNLKNGLGEALEKNIRNKELLNLKQIKLFEIGSVWKDGKEEIVFDLAVEKVKKQKTEEEYKKEVEDMLKLIPENPTEYQKTELSKTLRYQPFSRYPYIVRDIALWVLQEVSEDQVKELIQEEAGSLCAQLFLFDTFEKEGKHSLAYRLIFQSYDRTLTDEEVNVSMEKVYEKLKESGFEIR